MLVAVAEELSVTRAAARVHAAPSTVSASVRAVERSVGAPLFERTTRSMRLTAAGERVLPAARAALEALDRVRAEAREPAAGLRGRVRVGLFPAVDALGVPAAASAFQERHPDVELTLISSPAGSTGLHEEVRRGRLDLAFSALPRPVDLAGRLLDELPLVAVLPADHPAAASDRVALADLARERWVDTLPGYANRVLLETALAAAGIDRRLVVQAGDLPSVVAFVRAGTGVAVLPSIVPTDGCVTRELSDDVPPWRLSLVWRAGTPLAAAAAAFRDELVARRG